MRQLLFCPEKTRQRNALHNPFVRLGAALLASLTIACPQQDNTKAVSAEVAKQSIVGTYDCRCLSNKFSAYGESSRAGAALAFTISENNGRFLMRDETSIEFGLPAIPVTKDENGFHFVSKSRFGTTTGTGRFSGEDTLISTLRRALVGDTTTFESRCIKRGKKLMKAVFIRPCEGQLYTSFANASTSVGGGSLQSVARDLLNSGVTDIFLALKTDGVWPGDDSRGQLLYDSRYTGAEEQRFAAARIRGFDPVGAFMSACRQTYAAAGKRVRFHAWFPVFADSYAAKNFGGQSGYLDKGLIGNARGFLSGNKPDCVSDRYAEPSNPRVVEYELAVLEDMLKRYPALSGINLDYIRYADPGDTCNCSNKTTTAWVVNAAAVEDFVKKVKTKFPNVVLSGDVRAISEMRKNAGQEGIIPHLDIILPMTYSYDPKGTAVNIKAWVAVMKQEFPTKTLMPILRGWSEGLPAPTPAGLISNLASDLAAVKTVKTDGYAVFTYELLLKETDNGKLSAIKAKLGY